MEMLADEWVLCLTSSHRFAWALSVSVHRFINFIPLFQPTLTFFWGREIFQVGYENSHRARQKFRSDYGIKVFNLDAESSWAKLSH
jgi:hypothetical protein